MRPVGNRRTIYRDTGFAVLAAALYGVSIPFSKQLLSTVPPFLLAALLYLGAGAGMLALRGVASLRGTPNREAGLARGDAPWAALVVLLDVAAPISLMVGLKNTTASGASLLSNFEIVTTSLIAFVAFREAIGRRQWLTIMLVTVASLVLAAQDVRHLSFSAGSLLVLLACVFWGVENNCTRRLSVKDPSQIVILKGIGSGAGSLLLAFLVGERFAALPTMAAALALGFFSYGLSIFFYVKAQRGLGASRTSSYYAAAPFIGAVLSLALLHEAAGVRFAVALVLLAVGFVLTVSEHHRHRHAHGPVEHEHRHCHDDAHHAHSHEPAVEGEHSHLHVHEPVTHDHEHLPDVHHEHEHNKT